MMRARTSLTHPLWIDTIRVSAGVVGMTTCPGKAGESVYGGPWNRDLLTDLRAIDAWGADALLCLIEDHEFGLLQIHEYAQVVQAQSYRWFHLPFPDGGIPGHEFELRWKTVGPEIHKILQHGGKIVIHCRGGLGRTGLLAARVLIESGESPLRAIEIVRSARVGAIETQTQEKYLLEKRQN